MTETNRIIAEFDGWTFDNYRNHWSRTGVNSIGSDVDEFASDLPYHSDWNLLMGVVEKIEALSWDFHGSLVKYHRVRIEGGYVAIMGVTDTSQDYTFYQTPYGSPIVPKIESVYTAVVAFINWYQNKNNENNTRKHEPTGSNK